MSAYIFVAVGGGSIGLLVGGIVTQAVNWHWIFFINIPVGVVTLLLGRALLEESEGIGLDKGVDVLGSITVTAALMLAIYAIVTTPDHGWGSAHTLVFGGAAIVLLGVFFVLAGAPGEPDHAAAHPARARPREHEHRARTARDRPVLDVLPRRALPRARARLQRAAHRRRLPAALARRGGALGRHHRPPDGPLRRPPRDAAGSRPDGGRAAAHVAARRALDLLPPHVLRPADPRPRRRPGLHPAARDRHGERAGQGRGPRLRHRQRLAADVRRDRPRDPRHDLDRPRALAAGRRRRPAERADRRLPARVPRRRRAASRSARRSRCAPAHAAAAPCRPRSRRRAPAPGGRRRAVERPRRFGCPRGGQYHAVRPLRGR